MNRLVLAALLASVTFACGGDPDVVIADFSDELVEAAGRSASIVVVSDQTCEALMAVRREAISDIATVVESTRTEYPIPPDVGVLDTVPRGRAIAIDVSVLDTDELLVSRGCVETTLPAGEAATIEVEMHALPVCDAEPQFVDIAIVLDASSQMQLANAALGNGVIDKLQDFLDLPGFPPNTTFSLYAHGPTMIPQEILGSTENTAALKTALDAYRTGNSGSVRMFEAVILAAARARTRAVCDRRPALLVVSAGPDTGPLGGFENAIIGLAAARGNTRDDLYTFGIALTLDAQRDLTDLVGENGLGEVVGSASEGAFANALSEARYRFQGLVGP